jgi:hypothetical protein
MGSFPTEASAAPFHYNHPKHSRAGALRHETWTNGVMNGN